MTGVSQPQRKERALTSSAGYSVPACLFLGRSAPDQDRRPKRKQAIAPTAENMKQKRDAAYNMKIMKFLPDFKVIWVDGVPGNDGWVQPLFDYIANQGGFKEEGVLCVARRRTNQENNHVLTNANNTYARLCTVLCVWY